MKIGVIGSGRIGATSSALFVAAGHEVALANSRGPDSLADIVADLGPAARAATVDEAARQGDLVLVAIPLRSFRELPAASLAGKLVIDANNYYPERDGHLDELDQGDSTSSELLARHLAESRVVKAFNTMYWETLASSGAPAAPMDERLVLFLAGDDAQAKRLVSKLIEEIGFAPIDLGSLRDGGSRQQPGSPIYNQPLRKSDVEAYLRSVSNGS